MTLFVSIHVGKSHPLLYHISYKQGCIAYTSIHRLSIPFMSISLQYPLCILLYTPGSAGYYQHIIIQSKDINYLPIICIVLCNQHMMFENLYRHQINLDRILLLVHKFPFIRTRDKSLKGLHYTLEQSDIVRGHIKELIYPKYFDLIFRFHHEYLVKLCHFYVSKEEYALLQVLVNSVYGVQRN